MWLTQDEQDEVTPEVVPDFIQKTGATFGMTMEYDVDGIPFSLIGLTITAYVRDAGSNLVEKLSVRVDNFIGIGMAYLQGTGNLWTIGLLSLEIYILDSSGVILKTQIAIIQCER